MTKPNIVGHSYGGLLGAEWLSKDVRNVKGMVAIVTTGKARHNEFNWFLSDPVWNDMVGSELLKRLTAL